MDIDIWSKNCFHNEQKLIIQFVNIIDSTQILRLIDFESRSVPKAQKLSGISQNNNPPLNC